MKVEFLVLSAAFLLWGSSQRLAGQEPQVEVLAMSPSELERLETLEPLLGRTVKLSAKFRECWGGRYVSLMGFESVKLYLEASNPLRSNLSGIPPRDSSGKALSHKSSNIDVRATVVANNGEFREVDAKWVLRLESVARLPDDLVYYDREFNKLLKAKRGDFAAQHRKVAEARAWSERYENPKLAQWADDRDREVLKRRLATLPRNSVQRWIDLANDYDVKIKDRVKAIAVLDSLHGRLRKRADKLLVEDRLKLLGAYYYKKRWLQYREFKKAEGYVEREVQGKRVWLSRERAELQDVMSEDRVRDERLMVQLDGMLKRASSRGKVELSMNRLHIANLNVSKVGLGYPDYVDRRRIVVGQESRIYDQWIYRGQYRFYFVNDRLIKWFSSEAPLGGE